MTKERLSPSRWRSIAGILATALLLGLYARGGPAWVLGFVALVPWLLVLGTDRTMLRVSANAALMSIAFTSAAILCRVSESIEAYRTA